MQYQNMRDEARIAESQSPSGASRLPLRADADEGEGAAGESEAASGAVTGAADAPKALGTAAPASGKLNGKGDYPFSPLLLPADFDAIYAHVRKRAEKDPGILELLARRPELRVTVKRQTIEADGGTLRGALAVLISKKFFDSPQNGNSAFNELKRLGRAVAKPNVYRELDKLAELGFVTKEETGYQAVPGMKIHILEEKSGKAAAAR